MPNCLPEHLTRYRRQIGILLSGLNEVRFHAVELQTVIESIPREGDDTLHGERRLFREQTGWQLPAAGNDWEAWHGNHDEPSYVAWLAFRYRSNLDFHRAVKAHYEGLGLRPLRPNYVSGVFGRNPTAYVLDDLPDLDWVFLECCFSTVIRYSWPGWAIEANHRHALGRLRGIPGMAMFYPDRPDTMIFTWALAMSWGVKSGVTLGPSG